MAKILVISAHPDFKNSLANKTILEEFKKQVPSAEIVHLAELYPDYNIDAAKEQSRLNAAEMIIFEYPFWWYGTPSLLKRYIELVFTHGYAYGAGGDALKGKNLALSFTVGGPESEYQRISTTHHIIEGFLADMFSTADFTGMIFRGSVYSFDMANFDPADTEKPKQIVAKARDHAERLVKHIQQFIATN